ncbi:MULTISPECIES: carbonic anhydrase [Nitrospirillum]|uniref:Carbonic anhydrase n=1 Tax=Nitrospirillum amazonense TaxID=28077 RepID=A0A560EXJ7_9PROT|nr:carbonic anhydrase [Nitrospirillum amazonense]MEC4594641.1 carbonic anhydrase [Nitrospirillum amazonense]TWB14088.1 carbonic anhydrase [Nitrospirillum amazonense]
MDSIIDGVSHFRSVVFPEQRSLYRKLAHHGQQPKALVISCADSRVVPEIITQSGPGEMFVCRNAGNIVPPFSQVNGGVSSAIEYAVVGLGVNDIVVCGHSDCGAMKALLKPEALKDMPNVAAWLRHAESARHVLREAYSLLPEAEAARVLAMENVVAQLNHLRSHPSVAAKLAAGQLNLHGWFFDLENGHILALDGETGKFLPVGDKNQTLQVAVRGMRRVVADPCCAQHAHHVTAAE